MRLPTGMVAALVAVAPSAAGCGGGMGCTDVRGTHGVGGEIPKSLFVHSGEVAFEVCDDDGCATATKPLGHLKDRVGRGSIATFDDLGRDFDPGEVTIMVQLFDARGSLVAETEQTAELDRDYPNGKECDGDGYVSGGIELRAGDRV